MAGLERKPRSLKADPLLAPMIRTVLIGSMLQISLLDARAYSIHWRGGLEYRSADQVYPGRCRRAVANSDWLKTQRFCTLTAPPGGSESILRVPRVLPIVQPGACRFTRDKPFVVRGTLGHLVGDVVCLRDRERHDRQRRIGRRAGAKLTSIGDEQVGDLTVRSFVAHAILGRSLMRQLPMLWPEANGVAS